MPKAGNFAVSIVHPETGVTFEEFKETTSNKSTECYIESKSGEGFKIAINLLAADDNQYSGGIYVDGSYVTDRLLGEYGGFLRMESICQGMDLPNDKLARFMFQDTHFTEDGSTDQSLLSGLGSIVVKIRRAIIHEYTAPTYGSKVSDTPVNEKAKKALLTHSVKLATPITYKPPLTRDVTYLDTAEQPTHTFTFLYRSRTILEALDILPSIPIPEGEREDGSTRDDDEDEDEDEDDQNLDPNEKIRLLRTQLRELKKRVKQEPDSAPEVIDLTGREAKKRKIVLHLT